jgi:protein-S-isoprenylcysteine O-methyltransferase Ste14
MADDTMTGHTARTAASGRTAVRPARRFTDLGRLAMVPAVAGLLLLQAEDLAHEVSHGSMDGWPAWLAWLGTGLSCVFYALIIWCYLRRCPASATSRSVTAHAAGITATWAPFAISLLPRVPVTAGRQLAADLLLAGGTAWAVWSLRSLGRNLSVLAQARAVADRGPYRFVRHPLYTGELVSTLGLALAAGTPVAFACWLGLVGLQVYRALREEQVLLQALPGYRIYRSRTAALLPGIF